MTEHDFSRGMPGVELPAATDRGSRCLPRPLSVAFAAPWKDRGVGGPGDRVISRRTVFRGILLALLAAPLAVGAQPGATVYRIGFLGNIPPTKDPASQRFFSTFVQGLREAGRVEGRNTTMRTAAYGLAVQRVSEATMTRGLCP